MSGPMRTPSRPRALLVLLVALLAVVGAGCGSDSDDSAATTTTAAPLGPTTSTTAASGTTTASKATGNLTVFAAASLTDSFKELGAQFEAANPGAEVTFNFAASSALVQQINEGAPADVYASADEANMTKLTDAGENGAAPELFAQNALEIIVGPGNPKGITGLADLAKEDVVFVTCAPQVPVGKYSAQAFEKAGVTATPVSYEADVKAVVTKVTSGEADAGIVYATDVKAAGDKGEGIEIPTAQNVVANYPIVVTKAAPNPTASAAFVDLVTSNDGSKTLEKFGFAQP